MVHMHESEGVAALDRAYLWSLLTCVPHHWLSPVVAASPSRCGEVASRCGEAGLARGMANRHGIRALRRGLHQP